MWYYSCLSLFCTWQLIERGWILEVRTFSGLLRERHEESKTISKPSRSRSRSRSGPSRLFNLFLQFAVIYLFLPASTGSAAADPRSPAAPAACAGCSLCSGALCCIRWCGPFRRRPRPDTWRSGSSAGTLLWQTKEPKGKTGRSLITIII